MFPLKQYKAIIIPNYQHTPKCSNESENDYFTEVSTATAAKNHNIQRIFVIIKIKEYPKRYVKLPRTNKL